MSRSMPVLFSLALIAASAALAQQPALLHSFKNLQGVALSQGAKWPDSKLEVANGALHISSVSPKDAQGNSYLSATLTTAPVDMRGKALLFEAWTTDPKAAQALYVRGYDAKGQPALSWMSWAGPLKAEKTTYELHPGIAMGLLPWEPGFIKTDDRSAVVKWEFFVGAHDPGVAFDLFVGNLRLEASTLKSFEENKEAHKLMTDTPLVTGGRPQLVLYAPADPAWKPAVDDLLAAYEKANGCKLPVRSGDGPDALKVPGSHAIVLGNVGNNRALLYPYSHYMTPADAYFPGAGGYELRTVCNPRGDKQNLLIIGASDLDGAKAGVGAFAKHLAAAKKTGDGLVLARLMEIKPSDDVRKRYSCYEAVLDAKWFGDQQDRAEKALEQGAHTGLFGIMSSIGESYVVSGRDEYAKLFVWLARRAQKHTDSKPNTFGGPWGMDSDFMGHRVIPLWDALEESPALSDADRLEVSRILFRWIKEAALPEGSGAAAGALQNKSVSNHGTFAALATFLAGEYFSKYYDSVEAKQWVKIGEDCFHNLARAAKAHEDCNGYQWLTNSHIMRYALTKPDFTIFENGNGHKIADYATITMNNLGYQVPYGDTGEWKCWFSELPVLRMAEWYYRDGTYRWTIDRKVEITGRRALWEYDPGGAAVEPAKLADFTVVPLDGHWYEAMGGEKALPLAKAFDKIAFRDSFDPKAPFILIDGLSNGGHRHMDGNSVLQWTENERVWIADADYIKSLPKYHNGVLILKDGQSATIPDFVEAEYVDKSANSSTSVTTYRNYAGVDWRRNIVWLKGRMFVVADQMVAREPGDYSFRAIWQTVGNAKLNGPAMDVEQGGQWARFATTADARVMLDDDPGTGKNWASYPYAGKPIVRVMQGIINKKLAAGETVTLFTVLNASGEKASEVKVGRLDANSAVITGAGAPVVVQTAAPNASAAPVVKTDGVSDAIIKQAQWIAPAADSEGAAPALKPVWSYAEKLDTYLITNNPDAFEAVDAGVKLSAKPEPLPQNIFAQDNTNTVDNLLDGALLTSDGGVMWADGQQVTLDLAFDNVYDLNRLLLKSWFASSSSKNKLFQLGSLKVLASTDGFKQDSRTLVDFTDTEQHGNWGAPSYGPQSYDFPKITGQARQLRLILTPRPGTALYLSELMVWGDRPGLAIDMAAKLASGAPVHTFTALKSADLTGDGNQELLAGSTNGTVYCFAEGGKILWKGDCGATVNDVSVVDFNGDGKKTVIAGCMEARMVAFDASGKQLWIFNPPYYKRAGHVRTVFPADITGTGKQVAIAGADNWHYYAVDANGKEIWRYESVHGSTAGCAADMDGDKKQEIIAGTEYYWWHVINPDGSRRFGYNTKGGPCANAVAAGDLNGDGKQEALFGGADTLVHALDADGKLLWTFNTGDEVEALKCADVNGDGKDEVLIGSLSFNLYCLDGSGKPLWRHDLGNQVRTLATLQRGNQTLVAAGCDDGNVYVFNGADGKLVFRQPTKSDIVALTATKDALVASTGDGNLTVFDLP